MRVPLSRHLGMEAIKPGGAGENLSKWSPRLSYLVPFASRSWLRISGPCSRREIGRPAYGAPRSPYPMGSLVYVTAATRPPK
jgi:hypothetical protein